MVILTRKNLLLKEAHLRYLKELTSPNKGGTTENGRVTALKSVSIHIKEFSTSACRYCNQVPSVSLTSSFKRSTC